MQAIYDLFPVICFGVFYYLYGIYAATASAMVASFLQVVSYFIRYRRFEKIQTITFFLILLLGGFTLFFHNTLFIKWKPTVVYWLFGLLLGGGQWLCDTPVLQKLLGAKVQLPDKIWGHLTWMWCSFFIVMGTINLFIAYQYSTKTWVYFKVIGTTILTLLFVVAQAFYLVKYLGHSLAKSGELKEQYIKKSN